MGENTTISLKYTGYDTELSKNYDTQFCNLHIDKKTLLRPLYCRGGACPRPRVALRFHSRAQIVTDKQHHIIRPTGITDGSALPPPLPDMLSSQAQIKFGVRRRIIAVTQPEARANPTSCRRFISLIPPGTHLVLLICIFIRIIRSATILLLNTVWIITTRYNYWNILPAWTTCGKIETYIRIVSQVPVIRPGRI